MRAGCVRLPGEGHTLGGAVTRCAGRPSPLPSRADARPSVLSGMPPDVVTFASYAVERGGSGGTGAVFRVSTAPGCLSPRGALRTAAAQLAAHTEELRAAWLLAMDAYSKRAAETVW